MTRDQQHTQRSGELMPRIRTLKPQLIHSGPIPEDLAIGQPAWNRQFVYHLYDAAGEVLYIGRTAVLKRRFHQHRRQKPWWPRVASAHIYRVDGQDHARAISAAAALELAAIHTVLPLGNLMGPVSLPAKLHG